MSLKETCLSFSHIYVNLYKIPSSSAKKHGGDTFSQETCQDEIILEK